MLFLSFQSLAQDKTTRHESMIWMEAVEKVKLSNRLSTTLLWQHRIFFDRQETYQDIYWLSASGKISQNLSLTGGIMYFTYHRFSFDRHLSVPEWRPFQSIAYTKKLGKVKTNFRVMFEERYTRSVEKGSLQDDHNFHMRLRNRVQVFVPLHSLFQLEISEEILLRDIHQGKGVFDQSRARARLHFSPGAGSFSINGGYLHWLVSTATEWQHRHSIMVGVGHKF